MPDQKDNYYILFICTLIFTTVFVILLCKKSVTHHKIEDTIQDNIQSGIDRQLTTLQKLLPKRFQSQKEGMKNLSGRENIKVVCLGDSIFQNKDYVGINDSVQDKLTTALTKEKSSGLVLAQDNAKIQSVHSQIKTLEDMQGWGGNNDYIFLSVGGNDILTDYNPISHKHSEFIGNSLVNHKRKEANRIFRKYVELVKKICKKFPGSKVVLSTIYYPQDEDYVKYHNVIKYWNQNVIDYANDHPSQISTVLRTDKLVKNPQDFTHFYEPSAIGSRKIVEGITQIVS